MGVKFRSLAQSPGSVSTLQFTDSFATAGQSWGPNWLNVVWGMLAGNAAASAGRLGQPSVVGGQGVVSTQGGAATPDTGTCLIPIPVFQGLYNQPKTFARCKWVTLAGTNTSALALRFNSELTNGFGGFNADFYRMFLDNGTGGRVDRITGAGATTLQAATWLNPGANDIFEFRATVIAANITLQTFQNGALVSTIVDAVGGAGGRILMGSPAFHYDTSNAGAGSTVTIDDFACGVFT